jgi:hypothetical protein
LNPMAGTRAEKQTCRHALKLIRLDDLVFDIAQQRTPNPAQVAGFVGWSKSLIKKDAPAARGMPGQSPVGW